MDFISVGEMLIDFTPGDKPLNYTANPGGAPANVAIAASRNGIQTGFLGVMGNDDFGKLLQNTLSDDQVIHLSPQLTDDATTTLAFVTLYEGGERSFTFVRNPGADILLSPAHVQANVSAIAGCKLLNAGSFSLSAAPSSEAIKAAVNLAKENDKMVSFDINYRDMIWHSQEKCLAAVEGLLPSVDFLKISDEELFFVGGQDHIPQFMEQYGISVVIQTLGSQGAMYFFREQDQVTSALIPSKPVKAIDATGAGDAFWGGFLSELLLQGVSSTADLTEEKIARAVAYGNASGGLCVQKSGGIPALPTREKIVAFLQED